jgi:lysozyme
MKTSPSGRAAISAREGNVLTAYRDSVGIWTIGCGHTSAAGAPKVVPGLKITAAESDEILSRDLAKFEAAVSNAVRILLNQNELDALVSLAFNIGGGAFANSTLVRKLNAGDRAGAANQFLVWDKAGGKILKGLSTRREAERKQFLGSGPPAQITIQTPAESISPMPTPSQPDKPQSLLASLLALISRIFTKKDA